MYDYMSEKDGRRKLKKKRKKMSDDKGPML
jgi:hypothetical protein